MKSCGKFWLMKTNNRSLSGKKILVTRPEHQSANLCQMIESLHGIAIRFPTIEIQPMNLEAGSLAKDQLLMTLDIAVFVSRNAVIHAQRACPKLIEMLRKKTVLAAGQGTARCLTALGLYHVMYSQEDGGSEALLGLPALSEVKDKEILIVRGQGGREWLKERLTSKGARVRYLEVYRRRKPDISQAQLEKIWHDGGPDAVIITSMEGLTNLVEVIPAARRMELHKTTLVVMSERIKQQAVNLGFNQVAVAPENRDSALVEALMNLTEI